jgi:hypothetical protein
MRGAIIFGAVRKAWLPTMLGGILCDKELEFQGLGFFCASFLGEAAIRCQVFSKNVGKVVEVKPKRESLENHALLSLLNGVLHLLCNSTSNEYVSRTLCKSLEDMYLVSISNLVTSNISH